MTTEISVTQALSEIKLLRSRIHNSLSDATFIMLKKKRSDLVDVDKFASQARASYQSFNDLLSRYMKLKSAVVRSNAITTVKIAGKTYTVADAVEQKRAMKLFHESLLEDMMDQYKKVKQEYDVHQFNEHQRVERLLSVELGKDSKTNVEVVKALTDTLLAENRAEILDPLKLEERIQSLKKEIEDFQTNVDWILAESNGRTMISLD
jgi:cell division septum initiation protein DivIVA